MVFGGTWSKGLLCTSNLKKHLLLSFLWHIGLTSKTYLVLTILFFIHPFFDLDETPSWKSLVGRRLVILYARLLYDMETEAWWQQRVHYDLTINLHVLLQRLRRESNWLRRSRRIVLAVSRLGHSPPASTTERVTTFMSILWSLSYEVLLSFLSPALYRRFSCTQSRIERNQHVEGLWWRRSCKDPSCLRITTRVITIHLSESMVYLLLSWAHSHWIVSSRFPCFLYMTIRRELCYFELL